jgi:hypothetical protein
MDTRAEFARNVAREFTRYFAWFAESISRTEREAIRRQLSLLERLISHQRRRG